LPPGFRFAFGSPDAFASAASRSLRSLAILARSAFCIEADLGGASNLTETQRQLIQRCAVMSARWAAGQKVDLAAIT
jgi:hypothetical protein